MYCCVDIVVYCSFKSIASLFIRFLVDDLSV